MENNLVYRLPDSYKKPVRNREEETATNTWRLFALTGRQADAICEECGYLFDMLDFSECTGDALNRTGEMYGCQRRTGKSDAVYRAELLAKIAGYFSDASADTILQVAANMFGLEVGALYFKETKPATVQIHLRSPEVLDKLPVTLPQLKTLLSGLLAVGVGLESDILIDGTFLYCAVGDEKHVSLNGTGYNEPPAIFGTAKIIEEATI